MFWLCKREFQWCGRTGGLKITWHVLLGLDPRAVQRHTMTPLPNQSGPKSTLPCACLDSMLMCRHTEMGVIVVYHRTVKCWTMCAAACSSVYRCNSTQQLKSLSQNSERQSQMTNPTFHSPLTTIHFTAKQLIGQCVDLECDSYIMHFPHIPKGLPLLFVWPCLFVCVNEWIILTYDLI